MAGTIRSTPDIFVLNSSDDELPSLGNSPVERIQLESNISKVVNDKQRQDAKELSRNEEMLGEEGPHSSSQTESVYVSSFKDAYSGKTVVKKYVNNARKRLLDQNKSIINSPEGPLAKRIKRNGADEKLISSGMKNENLALLRHREVLQSYCRMCCQQFKSNQLQLASDMREFLSAKLKKDFLSESPDVYPSNFCTNCFKVLEEFARHCSLVLANLELQFFDPHGADCKLCNVKRILQPKGRLSKNGNSVSMVPIEGCNMQESHSFVDSSLFTSEESDRIMEDQPADKTECNPLIEKRSIKPTGSVKEPGLPENDKKILDFSGSENETVVCIPLNQVTESQQKLAKVVSCVHCERVPLDPYVSNCVHIFCKKCIEEITDSGHQCANKGKYLKFHEMNISLDILGIYKALVNTFMFKCKNNCDFVGTAKDLLNHELVCAVEVQDEMLVDAQSETRLKLEKLIENLKEFVDQHCEDNNTCKEFVLFYSLRRFLKLNGDKRRVALLMKLWKDGSEVGRQLSSEECLALKVFLGYGKKMYRCHYTLLKRYLCMSYLRSPKEVEQFEQLFYPPSTDFSLECGKGVLFYKRVIDECVEPSDLGELLSCNGFQWKLTAALAKTLQEIAFDFQEKWSNHPNALFTVIMCDKYECIENSKLWRFQKNTNNPKCLIQYSFCILSVTVTVDGRRTRIYSSREAGGRIFRTIAVALPNDGIKDSMKLLWNPIEEEKRILIGKKLIVRLPNGLNGKFSFYFPSVVSYRNENLKSLLLESLDVNEYGGFCRFCDSNPQSWLENVGFCTTTKVLEGNLAHCTLNPLHFDVNFVKLLISILIHEASGVHKSLNQCNSCEIKLLNSAKKKIESLLMLKYNIQPDSLILEPQKYVNRFLNALQTDRVVDLIVKKSSQANVRQLFWRYFELRSVYFDFYDARNAGTVKRIKLKSFKNRAVIWVKFILAKFPYIKASSYLHLLAEHVEDILELPKFPRKSMSGHEVDACNNIHKSLLVEYLKSAWLKSSPYLRKKGPSFLM